MKRIYSILLAGVALVAVASCGNRGKKAEAVEDVVEEPAEVRVYSNAYDGYTNVRQKLNLLAQSDRVTSMSWLLVWRIIGFR